MQNWLPERTANWKKLPIEGALVEEIVVEGYGKRWHLGITTREPRTSLFISMGESRLWLEVRGDLTTEVTGIDDRDVLHRYLPAEELRLDLAEIDFPDDDREWAAVLERLAEGNEEGISWVIPEVRLRLTRTADSTPAVVVAATV